jgi:DNA-binding transcriptional regulator WhiA
MREILKSYLAGVFDARGFIRFQPENYHYSVFFNFTEKDSEIWKEIQKIVEEFAISKIYKSKKRKKEYQLYIGKKKNIKNFLMAVLPYSKRKEEILAMLKIIERRKKKVFEEV